VKSVVIGATSGLGWEITLELARQGHEILIVGQHERDISACASHLKAVYDSVCYKLVVNANDINYFEQQLSQTAQDFGNINYLFLPLGYSSLDDSFDITNEEMHKIVNVNFLAFFIALKIFMRKLNNQGKSGIVAFSSIATIRGRGKNIVYSASKRAIESVCESLSTLKGTRKFTVQCYRIGYTDTHQVYGKSLIFPPVSANVIAARIVRQLNRNNSRIFYLPRYWRILSFLIRIMPSVLFQKVPN
jgi:short-subunit dehydrogenase